MTWPTQFNLHWPSLLWVLSLHAGLCLFMLFYWHSTATKIVSLPHVLMATLITPAPVKIQTPLLKNTPHQKPLDQTPTSTTLSIRVTQTSIAPAHQKSVATAEPTQEKQPVTAPTAPSDIVLPRFDAAYLNNPAPEYPNTSRQLQEEGTVQLRVYVTPDGQPEKIEIKNSSGFARLDRAAQQAVRRWCFISAKQGEQAIAAWVIVPITFDLRN